MSEITPGRRELTPLENKGVPKSKIKLNAVFATVHHPEATGIGAREAAGFDTSGSSGQLRAFRPDLPFGCVWCGICNKPADFDEGGMHNLFGKPDKAGYHRGYILLRAMCHGAEADIMLSFEQARQHAGKVILAFPYPERVKNLPAGILRRISAPLALPAPPVRLLLRDKGQNYWTAPCFHRYEIKHHYAPLRPDLVAIVYKRAIPEEESDFDRRTREIMERFEKRNRR